MQRYIVIISLWYMRDCETMVCLATYWHSSVLRNDDVRLKGLPLGARLCYQYGLAAIDDARHLIMQCPELPYMMFD